MNEITTIKISRNTLESINKLKIHPRQPYEEVILKLISGNKPKSFSNFEHNSEITTVKLSKSTVELLNKLKIHPRQSYEEVIVELIRNENAKKK